MSVDAAELSSPAEDVDALDSLDAAELDLEVVYVFIAPPSFEELERRLIGRGTETAEQQARRLETAKVELAAESEFDVTIVNETVDQAAADLWSVIAKEYGL